MIRTFLIGLIPTTFLIGTIWAIVKLGEVLSIKDLLLKVTCFLLVLFFIFFLGKVFEDL